MFDVEGFAVAGISLIALAFGLTQFFKEMFGLEGKKVTVLSASIGFVLMAVYQGLQYIPEPYYAIVVGIVASLTFGLAASGFYKYGEK